MQSLRTLHGETIQVLGLCSLIQKNQRSKVNYENKTVDTVPAALGHAGSFRAWQQNDKLCAGIVALSSQRFRTGNGAAVGLLVCALCGHEHICRRSERPVEQKAHHAPLRPSGRAEHPACFSSHQSRCPACVAFVWPERPERTDEHRPAARKRGGRHAADPPRTIIRKPAGCVPSLSR